MNTLIRMLLLVIALVPAGDALADMVGVDSAVGGGYVGPGVLDTTSRAWETGASFLLDGETVTVDYGAGGNIGANRTSLGGALTPALDLFNDIRFGGGGGVTFDVTLTGLSDGARYNLAIFGGDPFGGGRGSSYEVLGSGLGNKVTTGDVLSSFIEDTNYVQFENLSSTGGVLTFRVSTSTDGVAMFNGFEIQSVPEPASIALLSALGLVLVGYRWQRRRRTTSGGQRSNSECDRQETLR
ncbi:MAG: PEP-CTERM sorting domain-containing protein [Pirellulales bacterium]